MGLHRHSSVPSSTGSRRRFARAMAALLALFALGMGSAAQAPLFTFVQTSDSQAENESDWQGFEDVLEVIANAGKPGALLPRPVDLVLFAGDITADNQVEEWVRSRNLFDTWLTSNNIPLLCIPGNHDQESSAGTAQRYEQYIASSAVWGVGSANFTGQNGKGRNTGWAGLRFIGFNGSNGAYNRISDSDIAQIQSRVSAAASANENVFLLTHHPHDGAGRIPLASTLTQPAVVGYMRGHSGSPKASKGLSDVSNPNVWDLNTNAIIYDRDLIYYEVFQNEIKAYVVILNDDPDSLPPAKTLSLVFPLRSGPGGGGPSANFSGTPRSGAAPLLVHFSDLSTGSPTEWLWNFGDGTTSTAASPDHVYTSPGTFTVSLRASNGAGSNTRTRTAYVTVSGSNPSVTLTSVADATTNEQNKNGNTGLANTIRVKSGTGTAFRGYVKFDLSGVSGAVTSAKLRLFVTDPSDNGGGLYPVSSSWTETGINWNNQPNLAGSPIANLGQVARNTWKEIDVTSAASGGGLVSFALSGGSPNAVYYTSREGVNKPQLVLTVQSTSLAPTTDFFTALPPASPAQFFEPIADAHVHGVDGNAGHVLARAQQEASCQSFLKFDLAALTGRPVSARLRMFVAEESPSGGSIYLVSNTWAEDAVHGTERPALPLLPLSTANATPGGTWLEFDVSAAIYGPGVVSFAHVGAGSLLDSEREDWQMPQLVVETGNRERADAEELTQTAR
jgi:PKD repeat protein